VSLDELWSTTSQAVDKAGNTRIRCISFPSAYYRFAYLGLGRGLRIPGAVLAFRCERRRRGRTCQCICGGHAVCPKEP
jgi:hypothetical protein